MTQQNKNAILYRKEVIKVIYLQTNSYNVDVAKVYGVRSAVFLSFLFRKLAESSEDSVSIERSTIYENTGLDEKEQMDIESSLSDIKVICVEKFRGSETKNHYKFDEKMFVSIQTHTSLDDLINEEPVKQQRQSVQKRTTKRDLLIKHLKSSISVESEVLRQSLCDWIDSVYSNPKGFLSVQSVSLSVKELFDFTEKEDTQIEIMNIAIRGGFRDLSWAINKYEQTHRDSGSNCWASYSETKSDIHTENGAF